jgi:hypothetical protein
VRAVTVRLLIAGVATAAGAVIGANVALWIAWRALDVEDPS